jgi:hypothetical protein
MARWFILSLLGCLVLAPSLFAQEGRLQQVRDETSRPATSDGDSGPKKSEGSRHCDDDPVCPEFNELIGGICLGVALLPFAVPAAILHDRYDFGYFRHYPYADDGPGLLAIDPPEEEQASYRRWNFRLAIEEGNDFRDLNRVGARFAIDSALRLGVQTNWNWYQERLPCGCVDNTLLGDTNLVFRFAQSEKAQLYSGVGFRTLTDDATTKFGFNFVYGMDLFPVNPVVLSTSIDLGTLGSADVVHWRLTAGVTWHGLELFGGYDWMRINHVHLEGPMLGLRFWF